MPRHDWRVADNPPPIRNILHSVAAVSPRPLIRIVAATDFSLRHMEVAAMRIFRQSLALAFDSLHLPICIDMTFRAV